jgi:hypothetical protein
MKRIIAGGTGFIGQGLKTLALAQAIVRRRWADIHDRLSC